MEKLLIVDGSNLLFQMFTVCRREFPDPGDKVSMEPLAFWVRF